ncbi:hypothetical protein V6R21_13235 [Limibacter armeniacum]|uniref:hypothetical protein n=1 Tax=Limibacter armeniacum TaxID=466084 RepID=UPI002FE68D24
MNSPDLPIYNMTPHFNKKTCYCCDGKQYIKGNIDISESHLKLKKNVKLLLYKTRLLELMTNRLNSLTAQIENKHIKDSLKGHAISLAEKLQQEISFTTKSIELYHSQATLISDHLYTIHLEKQLAKSESYINKERQKNIQQMELYIKEESYSELSDHKEISNRIETLIELIELNNDNSITKELEAEIKSLTNHLNNKG